MTDPKRQDVHVRTLVATFVFVDIVAFSRKSVAEQLVVKGAFTRLLHACLEGLDDAHYVVRDTGDGALVVFPEDPEHALYLAQALAAGSRDAAASVLGAEGLRIGINLGSVKEAVDVETRPNFIGDGVNAARRIVDFAEPGRIATSRTYYDAVVHLQPEYESLFEAAAARADKHGRMHDLFVLKADAAVLARLTAELGVRPPAARATSREAVLPLAAERARPGEARRSASAAGSPAAVSDAGPAAAREVPAQAHAEGKRAGAVWKSALVLVAVAIAAVGVWRAMSPAGETGAPAPTSAATPAPAVSGAPTATPAPSGATAGNPVPSGGATANPVPSGATTATPVMPPATPTAVPALTAAPAAPAPVVAPATADAPAPAASGAASTPAGAAAARSVVRPAAPAPSPPSQRRTSPPAAPAPAAAVESPHPAAARSPRCDRILAKATLGEPLTEGEKRELVQSCQ